MDFYLTVKDGRNAVVNLYSPFLRRKGQVSIASFSGKIETVRKKNTCSDLLFFIFLFFFLALFSIKSYSGTICIEHIERDIYPNAFFEKGGNLSLSITLSGTDVRCKGSSNGTISSVISGNSGGLVVYTLSPGSISNSTGVFSNLAPDNYTVTANDGGNIASASMVISEPFSALNSIISSVINVKCKGIPDGAVTVTGIGGTPAYSYSINGGTTFLPGGTFTGLAAGSYTIIVRDANLCTHNQAVTIFEPPSPLAASIATNTPACTNGSLNLSISPSGGTGPCSYSWTGPNSFTSTSQNPSILNPSVSASGTYNVTVTDANNCSVNASANTVVNTAPIVSANASPSTICEGSSVTLTSSSNIPGSSSSTLLAENFNGLVLPSGWSVNNTSTGGTPANASWTPRADGYTIPTTSRILHSNDNSPFFLSDSYTQNGTRTVTSLSSPSINTTGFTSLSLNFFHYFRFQGANNESASIQVSLNGTTWTNIISYTSTRGSATNFQSETIILNSYVNKAALYIRFYYTSDERARYWAIDNFVVSGNTVAVTPVISWSSIPAGFSSNAANPPAVLPSVTTTYTVTYTNPVTSCSGSASATVTVHPKPNVTISPNYCAVPGKIRLTAGGASTYVWSTGETTNIITVDIADTYSVTGTDSYGCTNSASLPVSTELVTNGDFSSGNVGFTNAYGYTNAANGLQPEGLYAVGNDPHFFHSNFWGRDHTTNNGNYLIVNGSGGTPPPVVWQQTVSVMPNTNYYFAAWAISLNSVPPYANLQFNVNGALVGTTAPLSARPNNNNPPFNWTRFYGSWNSGSATTAVISIVDLEPALTGNDFGLDDVSFGTLAPIPFTIAPTANTPVCTGNTLALKANITGGRNPIAFSWSGPNGFTSNLKNPDIPSVSLLNSGTYSLSVTDGYGCDPVVKTVDVVVNATPTPSITGPGSVCPFSPSSYSTQLLGGINYQWVASGGTISGSSNQSAVTVNWAGIGAGQVSLTSTNSISGCDSTVSVPVTISDIIAPVFSAPAPLSLCVEEIQQASFFNNDITPVRPEYYTFHAGNTKLNLDLSTFSDNCSLPANMSIHWKIDFGGLSPPPSITGVGQPSIYSGDILFPGDGVTFQDVVHTITYWIVDQSGNESIHHSVSITIHPRPIVTAYKSNISLNINAKKS